MEPAIFGGVIHQSRAALIERLGRDTFERAMATLPPADASAYRDANVLDWVPIRVIEAVVEACGRASGRDGDALNDEVSREGARRAFTGLWRPLLRITSDEALMTRGPVIFAKTYNRGRLSTEFPAPRQARVELFDWPATPDLVVRTLRIAIEELLKAAGRSNVRVVSERTRVGCIYRCAWSAD